MKLNFTRHFQALADKYPDREALVHVERDRRYTFSHLHRLTNQIANMMRDTLALGKGDHFVTVLENDNLTLLHLPTILKGEATGAFANYRDSADEHAWQIEFVAAKVVFIENAMLDSHYEMLRSLQVTIVCMDPLEQPRDGVLCFWDLVEQASDANPDVVFDDRSHTCLIRFTGGTTGQSKPAAYSADCWLGSRDSFYALPDADWTPAARTLHIAPISHGTMLLLLPTFYAGGCTVTLNLPDLSLYCRTIEQERITTSMLVPTILYRLLELPEAQQLDLSSLKHMFYGAAPMSPTKLQLLQEKFGNIFIQIYASTEHAALALSLSKAAHQSEIVGDQTRLASAGQVVPGVELTIMDGDGVPVAPGEIGEFYLRSRGTILGYYNTPDKTAEEFVDDYWKSGDMGYQDPQGFVYIVDRKKDVIISGGFNVYATEVEGVISGHPAVLMAAVVGLPHEQWGEAVHAEVMLRDGMSVDEADLIAYAKEHLARYKAPKSVTIVEQLPTSAVGKLLRRSVRDKYWKGDDRKIN